MGEQFAAAKVVDQVAHGASGFMVRCMLLAANMNGILNAQRYGDEILSIIVAFIHNYHLIFQHDNAQPRFAWICT